MTQQTSPPTTHAGDAAAVYLQQLHARRVQAMVAAQDVVGVLNVELDLVLAWLERAARAEPVLPALAHWCARAATSAAAALLAQRFDDGELSVQWPGEAMRSFTPGPGGAGGRALAPGRWLQALAAAWIVRDAQALAVLSDADAIEAMFAHPPADLAPAQYRRPWCETLAALERGQAALPVAALQAALAADQAIGTALDPQWLQADVAALLPLLEALAQGDAAQAGDALAAAQAAHDHYEVVARGHSRPAPSLLLTGLRALGFDRGLLPAGDDVLQPLVRGAVQPAGGAVSWRFAPQEAAGAEEIHWYFDLLGAPREGREHRLEQRGDALVAMYWLPGWPAVPGAQAQFTLQDDARLMDAAQLLAVADRHAAAVDLQPQADLRTLRMQRAHLADAVAALDLAQARLPGGGAGLGPGSGSGMGHLAPSSLAAVRQTYQRLLTQVDARLTQAGASK